MKRLVNFDIEKHQKELDINLEYGKESTKVYTPSVATEFEIVKHKNTDGNESISLTSDIQMLLRNQEIINRDPGFVQDYIEDMIAKVSKNVSKPSNNLSDAQLKKYIKSRHIQSIGELEAYGKYILGDIDYINEDINDIIESVKSTETSTEAPKEEA